MLRNTATITDTPTILFQVHPLYPTNRTKATTPVTPHNELKIVTTGLAYIHPAAVR